MKSLQAFFEIQAQIFFIMCVWFLFYLFFFIYFFFRGCGGVFLFFFFSSLSFFQFKIALKKNLELLRNCIHRRTVSGRCSFVKSYSGILMI